jgi:hypothetical protein
LVVRVVVVFNYFNCRYGCCYVQLQVVAVVGEEAFGVAAVASATAAAVVVDAAVVVCLKQVLQSHSFAFCCAIHF